MTRFNTGSRLTPSGALAIAAWHMAHQASARRWPGVRGRSSTVAVVAVFGSGFVPVGFGLGSGERFVEIGDDRPLAGADLADGAPASVELFGHPEVAAVVSLRARSAAPSWSASSRQARSRIWKSRNVRSLGVFHQQFLGVRHQVPDPRVGVGPGQFLDLAGPDLPAAQAAATMGRSRSMRTVCHRRCASKPGQLADMADQRLGRQVTIRRVHPRRSTASSTFASTDENRRPARIRSGIAANNSGPVAPEKSSSCKRDNRPSSRPVRSPNRPASVSETPPESIPHSPTRV